ncbi:hypothetical protein KUTeg_009758 [Tegillarca granosa]|uniref:Ubiquitinyl hydrolase 1 n=1 Tax=Tegillarca granosa TaxID=220873 RepID=A0ABQ9F7Y2_TEGGR|nr:hypothetical protein KUTeg_009758 [Tegillarca granosa]
MICIVFDFFIVVFGMYSDDTYSYVQKDEMDRKVLETEGQVSGALSTLFADVMEETDISELEKRYWVLKSQSKSGKFDQDTFRSLVCPPIPDAVCEGLFMTFDENRDNHIDFKEMACGISACCRGPTMERQKFCFKVFDTNHDGKLSQDELKDMVECLVLVTHENRPKMEMDADVFYKMDPEMIAKEILACHDGDKDGCITMEEYLVWTVNNTLANDFLDLLSQILACLVMLCLLYIFDQICHIVMGLKPQTIEEEGNIIRQWLDRESKKSFKVGQVWYLISIQWWNTWKEYVTSPLNGAMNGSMEHSVSDKFHTLDPTSLYHHKITKQKNQSKSLPWDDNSVVVVNVVNKGRNTEPVVNGGSPSHVSSQTLPRASSAACNSSLRHCLQPVDSVVSNNSPSQSPKLSKKVVQVSNSGPQKPGAIDNSPLLVTNTYKVMTLTNEGGRLRKDTMLVRGKDFELVPEAVWRALSVWYGGNIPLPRTVVTSSSNDGIPELELYPVTVRLLRHQVINQRSVPMTTFTGMMSGIGGMALSTVSNLTATNTTHRRYLAYIAAFSKQHTLQQVYEFLCTKLRLAREDTRLWKIGNKEDNSYHFYFIFLVRNKDLTWPEEMSQLAKNKTCRKDQVPTHRGATGLNNLGNTCFMNAAVQCVSNTWPLTQYFTGGLHFYELNRTNPLGMKGHIAQRYGELVKDLWSGTSKTIAPLKLRQHDSHTFCFLYFSGPLGNMHPGLMVFNSMILKNY